MNRPVLPCLLVAVCRLLFPPLPDVRVLRHCLCVQLVFWVLTVNLIMHETWADSHQPVFQVYSARFILEESVLRLNAMVTINLPDYIISAIEQGFAVPLYFKVEILEARDYWFDQKMVSLKQQYRLHFLPMLGFYVVSDIDAARRYYFESRNEAVAWLQTLESYPILDIGNISSGQKVYARMRFGLDADALPLPLKSVSFWGDDWELESEWFDWKVDQSKHD